MPVEAKICGLSTPETLDAAVRFGARFVGFVTYPKSPRHISTDTMRTLGARVPKEVTRVGLFVDPDDALLEEKLATGALDLQTGAQVLEALSEINRLYKSTTLIITHNADIARMGARVVRFADGRVREIETNATPAKPSELVW